MTIVWQQSELYVFSALTSVGALFVLEVVIMNKKLLIGIIVAVLLVVAIILGVVFMTSTTMPSTSSNPDDKYIPVYEGMTVSNSAPSEQVHLNGVFKPELFSLITNVERTIAEQERLPENLWASGDNCVEYYADSNEDIYITVHITNPKSFEILSFTLNGVKYQSYMFEYGSDSENLILKVNIGDEKGIVDFTIDAIKYIENDQIKDVKIRGNKTVNVGVCPDEQPQAFADNVSISYQQANFDVLVEDSLDMIKHSNGAAYFCLFKDSELYYTQEVQLDEAVSVKLSNLVAGELYKYMVVAVYDALDGEGFGAYVLSQGDLAMENHINISSFEIINGNDVSFNIENTFGDSVKIEKVELIDAEGNLVKELTNTESVFENVALGKYRIRVIYKYGDDHSVEGYAYSENYVSVKYIGSVGSIVQNGIITKEYDPYAQVWNESTQDYRVHLGIDVIARGDDKGVYSPIDGRVVEVTNSKVTVKYTESIVVVYESLENILVSVDDIVTKGQKIGELSSAFIPEVAEEDHLHLEVLVDGAEEDPLEYFEYQN